VARWQAERDYAHGLPYYPRAGAASRRRAAHLTRPTCTDQKPTIGLTLDTQLALRREPMALAAQMVMTLTAKASSAAAALARRSATPGAAPRRSR